MKRSKVKRVKKKKAPPTKVYRLEKGMSRGQALAAVREQGGSRDFRGFTYDEKTGEATAT